MPTINIQMADGSRGDWLPIVLPIVLVVWLATLWRILHRADFDSITRLTWVIVVIFVPVFGMVIYWCSSPPDRWRKVLPQTRIFPTRRGANEPDYKLLKK